MPLETAVYKMTGLSAEHLGIKDRGIIKAGNFADLVLFNPATVIDNADVKNGKASDRIEFIPRFTTGVVPIEGTLPHNSVQNLLGLISGQILDYIEKLEFHIENDLGKLLNNLGKN